jgi:hypothetical protein
MLQIAFDWPLFVLNDRFLKHHGGITLLEEWSRCQNCHRPIHSLMGVYSRFLGSLRAPILLYEIIRPYAW